VICGDVAVVGEHCAPLVAPPLLLDVVPLPELELLEFPPLPLPELELLEFPPLPLPELLELPKPPVPELLLELPKPPLPELELPKPPLELLELELLKPPLEVPPSKPGFVLLLEHATTALTKQAAPATRLRGALQNFADILISSDDDEYVP
jgi:hypothetical protein